MNQVDSVCPEKSDKPLIIQSALLDYSAPFLVLVCYIRLVYRTSNFQIVVK